MLQFKDLSNISLREERESLQGALGPEGSNPASEEGTVIALTEIPNDDTVCMFLCYKIGKIRRQDKKKKIKKLNAAT